jgi:two-component system LytT family response regulator
MMRTILIDDEAKSNRMLEAILESYCPQVRVIGTADGVNTAVDLIQKTDPDLVFMDIEMTRGNAFDLLNLLQPVNFHVVFVTAFDNYAARAFRYNAVDYLLKPVNIRELCEVVEKLSQKLAEGDLFARVRSILENMQAVDPTSRRIAFPALNGLTFVPMLEIVRLEAKGCYTYVYLQDRTKITATGTLSEFEHLLSDAIFFRIHHSHIINLNKIKSYQKGRGGYVTMDDDSFIEVASRRREEFMQRLLK